ncbi:MAG: hypothetical protein ABI369_13090 [Acetobacteraceae bacterium]
MKTILAAFMALGMVISTGLIATGAAHAADYNQWNKTTITGNAAG